MRWFKHSTASHDDPDISDAMDIFGDFGYSGFFIVLEVYAEEFKHRDSEDFINISWTFLRRKLRKSSGKVEEMLNFFSERQRIVIKNGGSKLFLKVPKFIDLADNWSSRKLGSNSVVTTAIEGEEEVEEEKKIIKKKIKKEKSSSPCGDGYSESFNLFWNEYPKKVGKMAAYKAWKKLKGSTITATGIITTIKKQVSINHFNGFVPNPATWINDHRWEDEIIIPEKRRFQNVPD